MTARAGSLVAYDFAPHGITFAKPLVFSQQLRGTNASLLTAPFLQLGYYSDPSLLTKTGALVSELLGGTLNTLTWTFTAPIPHFSGYIVDLRASLTTRRSRSGARRSRHDRAEGAGRASSLTHSPPSFVQEWGAGRGRTILPPPMPTPSHAAFALPYDRPAVSGESTMLGRDQDRAGAGAGRAQPRGANPLRVRAARRSRDYPGGSSAARPRDRAHIHPGVGVRRRARLRRRGARDLRRRGDEAGRGYAENLLAIVEWKQSNLDEAERLYRRAHQSAHVAGESALAA